MAKFLAKGVNIDKYLDRALSFLDYVIVGLAVILVAALLILLLPAVFIADKLSQLWKAREARKRQGK